MPRRLASRGTTHALSRSLGSLRGVPWVGPPLASLAASRGPPYILLSFLCALALVLPLFRTHVCMAIEAAFPTTCSSLVTSLVVSARRKANANFSFLAANPTF